MICASNKSDITLYLNLVLPGSMETLFLIGGSGFIGKNLARHLSVRYRIVVCDKYIDKEFFSCYPSIQTIELDLVKEFLPPDIASPDYIINLSSIVTGERDLALFDELISSNLKVLLNLYKRFKDNDGLKLFIQFGSSEEYGAIGSPFTETMREAPTSPYALIKQLTVNTALMLFHNYGFPVSIVRPGNLFGPYQHVTKLIPYVITQLKKGETLSVSPCEQKRDFIYVKDFVWCIGELITHYNKCIGEIINVSSGWSISLKEIIEICKQEIGSNSKVCYGALPYRDNEIMDLRCSIEKLSEILEYKVNFDLTQRLKEFVKLL